MVKHTNSIIFSRLIVWTLALMLTVFSGGIAGINLMTVQAQEVDLSGAVEITLGEAIPGNIGKVVFYDDDDLHIEEAGVYVLSGTLNGQLYIESSKKKEVTLVLNGAVICNPADEAVNVRKTGILNILLADGTENVITSGVEMETADDAVTAGADDADASGAAIHSRAVTTITGNGHLEVNGYLNNGIQCSKNLTVESGDITINAVHHGLRSKDTITVAGGDITIKAGKDGLHAEREAEAVTDAATDAVADVADAAAGETADTAAEAVMDAAAVEAVEAAGTILIQGGTLTIHAGDEGIDALLDTAISGGDVTIISQGNGISADETLTLAGGKVDVDSFGDAVQAGLELICEDGEITLKTEGEYKHTGSEEDFLGGPGGGPGGPGGPGGSPGESGGGEAADDTVSEKGLKSDGNLTINGGTIIIDTVDDAVHCADTLTINGGTVTISCGDDGLHSDQKIEIYDGSVDIQTAYEGIEANQILVAGGDVRVISYDDGFNCNGGSDSFGGPGSPPGSRGGQGSAGGQEAAEETGDTEDDQEDPFLVISGGNVYVNSVGDGLDSNGSISISGGYTVVDGPESSFNGSLDGGTENGGKILISGGTIFAGGASGMAESFGASSDQCSFLITFPGTYQAGMEVVITSGSGEELFSHTFGSSGNSIVFSCPELQQGDTCVLTIDAGDEVYSYELTLEKVSSSFRASADGSVRASAGR